uniref:PH domain-containing protein n=1 Tax=Sinocyclocheilus rhinocerous TaxID=307959 RepID=A0A673HB64_9TELE
MENIYFKFPQHGRGSAKQIVLRCGWLRKQGGFVKTWHTRWFVLRGDQLYYYKDEDETKCPLYYYQNTCLRD